MRAEPWRVIAAGVMGACIARAAVAQDAPPGPPADPPAPGEPSPSLPGPITLTLGAARADDGDGGLRIALRVGDDLATLDGLRKALRCTC